MTAHPARWLASPIGADPPLDAKKAGAIFTPARILRGSSRICPLVRMLPRVGAVALGPPLVGRNSARYSLAAEAAWVPPAALAVVQPVLRQVPGVPCCTCRRNRSYR